MKCTEILELMLDVAPDELAGRGDSPLATHVRECARCRALADRLLADTRALAKAVESRAPRAVPRARRIPRTLIGGGALVTTLAAAALVLAVLQRGKDTGTAPAVKAEPIAVPGVAAAESTPAVANARQTVAHDSSVLPAGKSGQYAPVNSSALVPIKPQQYAVALPVQPTPLIASPAHQPEGDAHSQSDITVTPSFGLRAAVMRTSNPNITVVWLY